MAGAWRVVSAEGPRAAPCPRAFAAMPPRPHPPRAGSLQRRAGGRQFAAVDSRMARCDFTRLCRVAVDVTAHTPAHVERRILIDLRHLLNLAVTGLTSDARVDMAHMREVHVLGDL